MMEQMLDAVTNEWSEETATHEAEPESGTAAASFESTGASTAMSVGTKAGLERACRLVSGEAR